jgi:regulator of nonsense transcripts 2
MSNFLEVMMKLRNARNLDARQSALVDSAYFAVRAADRAAARRQREPEREYIRHLVYERLPQGQVTKVGQGRGGPPELGRAGPASATAPADQLTS